jgi:hypothetical protein
MFATPVNLTVDSRRSRNTEFVNEYSVSDSEDGEYILVARL